MKEKSRIEKSGMEKMNIEKMSPEQLQEIVGGHDFPMSSGDEAGTLGGGTSVKKNCWYGFTLIQIAY